MKTKKITSFVLAAMFCGGCATGGVASVPPSATYLPNIPKVSLQPYQAVVDANNSDASVLLSVSLPMSTTNGRIAAVRTGQPSPFDGVVLDTQAAASLEANVRAAVSRQHATDLLATQTLAARAISDIQNLQTTINTQRGLFDTLVTSRDRDIRNLQTTIKTNQTTSTALMVGLGVGGFVLGALAGVGIKSLIP